MPTRLDGRILTRRKKLGGNFFMNVEGYHGTVLAWHGGSRRG